MKTTKQHHVAVTQNNLLLAICVFSRPVFAEKASPHRNALREQQQQTLKSFKEQLPPERQACLRECWRNMSPEERKAFGQRRLERNN